MRAPFGVCTLFHYFNYKKQINASFLLDYKMELNYLQIRLSRKDSKMRKAVGYIRVSTVGQATEGVSLETQETKIRMYAELKDLNLIDVFVDAGLSGKSISGRPGIQSVLELVRAKKVDDVIIFKLDRLARNTKETLDIVEGMNKKCVSLHSVSEDINTNSANGKFFIAVLAAMATWERETISERTTVALQTKKQQGKRVSKDAEFGFKFEGDRVIPNTDEQAVIGRILALRADSYSLRGIVSQIASEGFRNRNGNVIQLTSVRRILERAA